MDIEAARLDTYMLLSDAAEEFGVQHDRLRRAALEGRLPAQKIGRRATAAWVVRRADVAKFLATTRRGPKRKAAVAAAEKKG